MPVVPITGNRWPTSRSGRDAFADHYGSAWCERFHAALLTGDPLADAIVALGGERAVEVRRQLARGLVSGLSSLDDPDECVVDLLRETESVPAQVDAALIASGPRVWHDVPFRLHLLSMSAGALIGVYTSPSIASVLSATGRLSTDTERRLHDTADWLTTTMSPGSLAVGEAGYVATVELRLIHAHARRTARRHGHDERRFGTAINQVDLVRTWLAFTLTGMRAQASLGFAPNEAEIAENYEYWQQVAHLLGIDPELVGTVRSHADAECLERMVESVSGTPDQKSVTLTRRTLGTVADALDSMSVLPNSVSRKVLETLVRRFHGDDRADALEIGRSPGLDVLMAPVIALARAHRALQRSDAACWSAAGAGRYADALATALADQAAVPQTITPVVGIADAPAALTIPTLPEPSIEPALDEAA